MKAALGDLDDLLARDAVAQGPPGHGPERSDLALLQLAALIIYKPASLANEDAGGYVIWQTPAGAPKEREWIPRLSSGGQLAVISSSGIAEVI